MKTKQEIKKWLLETCLNEDGNLVMCGIDLSKFKGKVILNGWKIGGSAELSFWNVKGDLNQRLQEVGENLDQSCQSAKNIYQGCQKVNRDLYQSSQSAKNIYQNCQTAENIYQNMQKVNGDLEQDYQEVNGDLYQHCQEVGKDLISQKLKEDEEWVDCWRGNDCAVIRAKKLKEISKDELAKMGYKLKEN